MSDDAGRRRYDSLRRTTQAHETRAEIARAARRLFVAKGWGATTVRDVAREAGVSVPTVYAAYRNKAGLAGALAESADLDADLPRLLADLETAPDPPAQLAAMAGYDRRLFERAADVLALVRDAARTEPALAAAYRDGRAGGDRTRVEVFTSWPPGVLRPGVDVPTAVDIYAALCNVDVYTVLVEERAWSPARVERWWAEALARELLA
ncbi:TetR/AcrR family transcriptional regulator [Actinophytocola gossypii]|uniref:TetR/AcrR family transcriptional regulator n=1 Tax=Actinophytocola gossypii TaxID=2812003 RepID=A0ABT2J6H4_9PSEU|nr:TetR/AcrR family transcriptional regulator [Actinophytocola gossypii]MCT2583454.1 TetR/AcrR family transcriptional regulator [Actinophytocola gossypii]